MQPSLFQQPTFSLFMPTVSGAQQGAEINQGPSELSTTNPAMAFLATYTPRYLAEESSGRA